MRNLSPLLALTALASVAQANLIVNGDFESAPAPSGAFTQYMGGSSFTGWNVLGNDVIVLDTAYTEPGVAFVVHGGKSSLDITGAANTGPTDGISQNIATTIGTMYRVSFYVGRASGNTNYLGPSTVSLAIGSGAAQAFTNSNVTPGSINWQLFTADFLATATSTSVTFRNATPTGAPTNNFAGLDDISVEAVPEPASLAALAIGAVAVLRRRARR